MAKFSFEHDGHRSGRSPSLKPPGLCPFSCCLPGSACSLAVSRALPVLLPSPGFCPFSCRPRQLSQPPGYPPVKNDFSGRSVLGNSFSGMNGVITGYVAPGCGTYYEQQN
ncbi:hypothetical protein K505DRAFT_46002 [Melanomma pulvis-pyrius CBS 109.77]|uniref:Uncharacterized protein n=1 Tax=Melanomma pulvis-pyrius CBS 109.77 TaxID=1314802 RepID=A0A6A6X9K7_9PLEO|nr:hypothetical protein K505DRAFT_46002 [Melanomma pulvis-pyrius CBS 109.77]